MFEADLLAWCAALSQMKFESLLRPTPHIASLVRFPSNTFAELQKPFHHLGDHIVEQLAYYASSRLVVNAHVNVGARSGGDGPPAVTIEIKSFLPENNN